MYWRFTVVSVVYVTCKGIQDSLEFRIPGTGLQFLSDPGFWTPIVYLVGFRIPWAVFRIPKPRIPDSISKIFPDFGFQKQKFPGFRNPNCLTRGESYIELSVKRESTVKGCFLLLGKLLLVPASCLLVWVLSVHLQSFILRHLAIGSVRNTKILPDKDFTIFTDNWLYHVYISFRFGFLPFFFRLRAVLLQSVKSKLGRTGESEMAEREASPRLSLASLDFLARAFLARVTILRDRSQSIFFSSFALTKTTFACHAGYIRFIRSSV